MNLIDISEICNSKKRLLILDFISRNYAVRYMQLHDIVPASSEMYKLLRKLIKFDLVEKDIYRNYKITNLGRKFIEILWELEKLKVRI